MTAKASPLAAPRATAEVLDRFGLAPKKRFGQNFLIDDGVVGRILALSEVGPTDDVLEVGPGIGTLSAAVAPRVCSLVAVERDAELLPVLAHTMGASANFCVLRCDALDLTEADLASARADLADGGIACELPNKLVANLPYAVAATVVLSFFQRFEHLRSATVMVQREVAERMRAVPGTKDYGAYTVKLGMFARPSGSFRVPPSSFMPQPRVDSTVIRLDRIECEDADGRPLAASVVRAACEMADAAFFARRKTIANSVRSFFASRGDAMAAGAAGALLANAGIDGGVRGETLAMADFLRLGQALANLRHDHVDRDSQDA